MRLTLLGKLVIFILAIGLAIGGIKVWRQSQQKGQNGTTNPIGQNQTTPNKTQPRSENNGNEIEFIITAAKKDWVGEQVDRFNAQNGGKWKIVTKPIPSREAMHDILEGKELIVAHNQAGLKENSYKRYKTNHSKFANQAQTLAAEYPTA